MRIFFGLLLSVWLHPAFSQVSEDVICAEKARFYQVEEIRKRSGVAVFHGYDLKYHRCHWKLNPKIGSNIKGAVLFDFQVERNTDSLAFDLTQNLQVDSVKRGNDQLKWERKGNRILVFKTGTWLGGSRDSFEVFYGEIPLVLRATTERIPTNFTPAAP